MAREISIVPYTVRDWRNGIPEDVTHPGRNLLSNSVVMGRSLKSFGPFNEHLVEQAATSYLVGARVIVTFNTLPGPRRTAQQWEGLSPDRPP